MNDRQVFEFADYKAYLHSRVGKPGTRNGLRKSLAEFVGCQTAYVSQVLNGSVDFSPEQGHRINRFFKHSAEEGHFFLLLLQKARAGTRDLREYFQEQLEQIRTKRLVVKERLGPHQALSKEDRAQYYSSWHYAAIHVALSVPELQALKALASYFELPVLRVEEILGFLTNCGLAASEAGRYRIGPTLIHLGDESQDILKHHTNWRIQAIASLDRKRREDIHYSAAVSLSRADALKLKDSLIETIQKTVAIITKSKEEEVFCFSLDLFGLGRDEGRR